MQPEQARLDRLTAALRLDTPLVALYDAAPNDSFAPLVEAKGRACCFAYYPRWCKGETLVVPKSDDAFAQPKHGCPGLQRSLGLGGPYPPWMANFLTDGQNGAPMGEGLKASPALAQAFIDQATPPQVASGYVLLGPLRFEHWSEVRALTFFCDPDRFAALVTLASYWSSDPLEVVAPFSSGCGLMWRELESTGRDRAIVGCTDIASRRHLPPSILSLTVSPARFTQMLDYPEHAFLEREWWGELLAERERQRAAASRGE